MIPQTIRKMASKIMPMLLVKVSFKVVLLSMVNEWRAPGPATHGGHQG